MKVQPIKTIFVFLVSVSLLFLYQRQTGIFLTPGQFFRSFSWSPVSGPFSFPSFMGVLMTSLLSVLVFLSWMFVAGLLGFSFLKRMKMDRFSSVQRLLMSLGLGLGALSFSVFALGVFHLLYPVCVLGLGLGALMWSFLELDGVGLNLSLENLPRISWITQEPAIFFLLALSALVLMFHFFGALLPPTSFDEMDYQLALPKLYVINHALVNTPFNHLSYLPKNMSLLFTLGLLSGGPIVSKLFSFAFGVLGVLTLYFFGRDKLGSRAAFWGASFFFLIPVFGNQMRNAVADLGTGFYELLGIFLLLEWADSKDRPSLFLSAIFWGLALGSKYTALPGFGVACSFVVFYSLKEKSHKFAEAFVFIGIVLSLFLPNMVWNFWWTGNPLTPLLSRFIRSRNFFFLGHYKPLVDYSVGRGIVDYFPLKSLSDVLKLPWRLCVRYNDYNHDLGAAFLVAFPLSFLSLNKKISSGLVRVFFFCGAYWLLWMIIPIHMTRYFVAGLALTSLLFGWIVSEALEGRKWGYLLLIPVVFAFLEQGARMIYIQNIHKLPWGYLSGRTSQDDYVDAILHDSPYDAEIYANGHIPKNSKILVFDEFRTFYFNRKFIASTPWDHELWHELVAQSRDGQDLARRLHALGITYFMANDTYLRGTSGFSWADPWSPQERRLSARFFAHRMKRIYTDGNEVWIAQIK